MDLVKNEKDISGEATVVEPDSVSLRHADNELLAQLGYRSEFKREFSVR
jgi:hypothetical protein